MPHAPQKTSQLIVSIQGEHVGQLLKASIFEFHYDSTHASLPDVALSMPAHEKCVWKAGALFAAMDQHLPEGDLLLRLSASLPKERLQPTPLLAMVRESGIGRLAYATPDAPSAPAPLQVNRQVLLALPFTDSTFDELADAYMQTGVGISGVQPKVMVADRTDLTVPSVIVKAAPAAYPGLAANEFLCLSTARRAGIPTPGFDLSHDGQMLIVDRFDLVSHPNGGIERLAFEDIAALLGLRVRGSLSHRKYEGSYQRIANLLTTLRLPAEDMHRFFEQVAMSIMVRNGDAHLKNFGVLVSRAGTPRLSPLFDVVTTAVYTYTRFTEDAEQTDRTMALKLFAGKGRSKAYPTTDELLRFGKEVCRIEQPRLVLERIAQAMQEVLTEAKGDTRVPAGLLSQMEPMWRTGLQYASTAPATRARSWSAHGVASPAPSLQGLREVAQHPREAAPFGIDQGTSLAKRAQWALRPEHDRWVTVVLDIDEVLCIGQPEAGWDLFNALQRGEAPNPRRLATLFSPVARNALAVVHRRLGRVRYVISSTWRKYFSREQLLSVLEGAGLQFVADNLHEGDAWRCPQAKSQPDREADIRCWLETHHQGEPFAIVDDHYSAGNLLFQNDPASAFFERVFICTPGTGLTMEHVDDIVAALRRPV